MPDSFDYPITNSENARLLQALIDDAPEYTQETNSRNANILKSIINNTEYTDAPQSEIEELLLRLKVKIGGEIEVDELTVTENGIYDAGVNKAYNPVTVELPLDSKTITANGTYTASDDNLEGFDEVTVAVEGYAKKSIENTPTDIATFNASAMPMPSLTVGIEATQDLHGYDHPWAGGTEKNKWGYGINTTPDVSGSYGGWHISYNTNVTLKLFDKGTTVDLTNVYLGLSESGTSTPVTWVINNGVVQSSGVISSTDYHYVSIYPNNAQTLEKIFSKFNVLCVVDNADSTTYSPYSNICPIIGWSAVNVPRTGKNIIGINEAYGDASGISIEDGVATGSSIRFSTVSIYIPQYLVGKQLTLSAKVTVPENVSGVYAQASVNNVNIDGNRILSNTTGVTSVTCTPTSTDDYLRITYGSGSGTITVSDFQIEIGSTATTYEAFSGTTYTTTLKDGQGNPLTCYGGQLANENGVQSLVNETNIKDLATITWLHNSTNSVYANISEIKLNSDIMCSALKVVSSSTSSDAMPFGSIRLAENSQNIVVKMDGITPQNASTMLSGMQLLYELATPTTIPQDSLAIASQDGVNNLWADSGNIQSGEYMEAL